MPFKGLDKSRYDPDGDGSVGSSDDTVTVKGNDIDTDGDGAVDKADDSDTLQGNTPSDLKDGGLVHNGGFAPGFGG